MEEKWIAWMAGIYEGEGCITRSTGRGHYIRIKMSDEDIVRRVKEIFGSGSFFKIEQKKPYKDLYAWQISGKNEIVRFMQLVAPYLSVRRRERFREVLDIYNTRKNTKAIKIKGINSVT